ncbi:unnamed protein product [Notodromas monacha]|uniref:Choline transporter-like protein n=1 Tax=Notodromas monacha TaxID=399045 RepID=A0A7R9BTM3_9CRUS|nr:unnamed protein product [Notodromas monacha]CAG0921207.1 unnamed protein product [Notodromas monacha]
MGCCGDSVVENDWASGKKGSPDELEEGPIKDRGCRDIPCLIIFLAFLAVGLFTLVWAGTKGDLDRMIHGYDKYGNVCGQPNGVIKGVNDSGKDMSNKPPILNRCGSSEASVIADQTSNFLKQNLGTLKAFFQEATDDIQKSWRDILYMALIALGFSLLVTILLRFLAFWIIWIIIGVACIGSVAATIALWIIWSQEKKVLDAMNQNPNDYTETQKRDKTNKVNYLFAGAISVSIITAIVLLLVIFMRNRIALVVALFKEAGKAVHSMPFMLLQPVWTCIALIIYVIIWLAGAMIIENAGDPVILDDDTVQYRLSPFFKGMRFYHLFSFFWMTQFIIACQHTTVAGSVASWFFTRDKGKLHFPILSSMWRVFRFHLGSLALGSLIVALVQMAARQAFKLLASNAVRVFAINSIGDFVLFLAKASIVVSVVFIGIEFMKVNNNGVTHTWFPVLIGAFLALLIAHTFISIYEMTVDTLFLCFCEDCERNDGVQRPYYMSKGLMEFVENSNKALQTLKEKENAKVNAVTHLN